MQALLKAQSGVERMEMLERFFVDWTGAWKAEYGETEDTLRNSRIPEPLRRLHRFAGRWMQGRCRQDTLIALNSLEYEQGRVVFLEENQCVWRVACELDSEDPPVWVDFDGGGWQMMDMPLTELLVTFCLQELLVGSRLDVCDDGIETIVTPQLAFANALWHGKTPWYVMASKHGGSGSDFEVTYWMTRESLLVSKLGESWHFAANSEEGIAWVRKHEGPVIGIHIYGNGATLDIEEDGSGRCMIVTRAQIPQIPSATFPTSTFDFRNILSQMLRDVVEMPSGHYNVQFNRRGQGMGRSEGLRDGRFAKQLITQGLAVARGNVDFDKLREQYQQERLSSLD